MNENEIVTWLKRANFIHGYDKNDIGMREWLTPDDVEYITNVCAIWSNIQHILTLNKEDNVEIQNFIESYQKFIESYEKCLKLL